MPSATNALTYGPNGEATKKATVTEMAPHLKLDANSHTTYAQMRWQVAWIDHVEQGDDDDPEDWNINYFGRTAKGRKRNTWNGKGRKGKR